ncbi:hypothetical protein [Hymenobacter properus]|uniref:Periplasmic heavy metal sensor n=1 Tax=Hymenobacter properus TaxID=2791026 RepID=A0A931FMW3_9BACT|nr:hypothetical protein [Hymenobacter properus]MBF9143506.1 hypothetical protein [Hymenobacter properus]MBR7722319.1 hypothetical protein [Microvirga sp. SRT04]
MTKNLLFLGLLLSAATAATAQTQPATPGVETSHIAVQRVRMGVNDINPEKEADQKASLLTGQLSLTPEQTARVRAAALVESQERLALLKKHNARTNHDGMKEEGEAITNKFENELKATLTPEQYERRLMIQARFRKIREQADAAEKAGAQPATRP